MPDRCALERLESRTLLAANLLADFGGIYPTDAVILNGVSYFAADDGLHGTELWRSDGTANGTRMVKDITAGSGGSDLARLAVVGDLVLFYKRDKNPDDSYGATALWASDGTAAGTIRLKKISNYADQLPESQAIVNGKLVFIGGWNDLYPGRRLFVSDGTVEGTMQIRELPLVGDTPTMVTVGSRAVFFMAGQLFTTDGTAAGTTTIAYPHDSMDFGSEPHLINGTVLFIKRQSRQLWKTDGTAAGTELVTQLPSDLQFRDVESIGTRLMFTAYDPDATVQWSVWSTDGTNGGVQHLGDFSYNVDVVGQIGSEWMLIAPNGEDAGTQIWMTDGTSAGTRFVDLIPDAINGGPGPNDAWNTVGIVAGEVGFLMTRNLDDRLVLWRCDGTAGGTALVQDLTDAAGEASVFAFTMAQTEGKLLLAHVNDRTNILLFDPATFAPLVGPTHGTFQIKDGVLRVFGTKGDDSIRIYRHLSDSTRFVVALNGVKRSFSLSQVSRIHIYGYSGNDNLAVIEKYGRFAVRSRVWGGGGDDTIFSGSGRDTVYGEAGDDYMSSGRNADLAMGGVGADWMYGGLNDDTVSGEEGADTVNGAGGADIVSGGDDASDDQIDGGGGIDVIFGQAVFEIFYSGQQGDDPGGLDEVLLM